MVVVAAARGRDGFIMPRTHNAQVLNTALSGRSGPRDQPIVRDRARFRRFPLFMETSIRQLARTVGLRESSIYNHFAGKEDIYTALIDSLGPASSAERMKTPRFQAFRDDPAGFCRLCADEILDQWLDPREQKFQELLRTERSRTRSARAHFHETIFRTEAAIFAGYFQHFAAGGLIRTTDPREASRVFAAGFTFIRLEHLLMLEEPSPRHVVRAALDRFVDTFLEMILADAA
ncbi:MAG: TetR/AcrR family transcriptional regulator [Phenylobacterium zucineum]|nr:MAG: TetR/AcrR family transcriptional regulator [Phenylobacterium zucineum]